jgi:hypothetical protein
MRRVGVVVVLVVVVMVVVVVEVKVNNVNAENSFTVKSTCWGSHPAVNNPISNSQKEEDNNDDNDDDDPDDRSKTVLGAIITLFIIITIRMI